MVEQVGIDILTQILNERLTEKMRKAKGCNSILAIDGGGARGIISVRILHYIETQLNKKIYELFDYIAGTSAGGLTALCISAKLSCDDITRLSQEIAKIVNPDGITKLPDKVLSCFDAILNDLGISPVFNTEEFRTEDFKNTLKTGLKGTAGFDDSFFEDDLRISLPSKPKILIPSVFQETSVDRDNVYPAFFANYDLLNTASNLHSNNILTAATATSSIINFICKTHKDGKFRDGGYYCNNPALIVFLESLKNDFNFPSLLLSLGNGKEATDKITGKMSQIDNISAQLNVNSANIDQRMKEIFNFQSKPEYPDEAKVYYRINPDLDELQNCIRCLSDHEQIKDSIKIIDGWIDKNQKIFEPILQRLRH